MGSFSHLSLLGWVSLLSCVTIINNNNFVILIYLLRLTLLNVAYSQFRLNGIAAWSFLPKQKQFHLFHIHKSVFYLLIQSDRQKELKWFFHPLTVESADSTSVINSCTHLASFGADSAAVIAGVSHGTFPPHPPMKQWELRKNTTLEINGKTWRWIWMVTVMSLMSINDASDLKMNMKVEMKRTKLHTPTVRPNVESWNNGHARVVAVC